MTWMREVAVLNKPGVGRLVIYSGVIRRWRVKHIHLISPDQQTTHCVPPQHFEKLVHTSDWFEAVALIRS